MSGSKFISAIEKLDTFDRYLQNPNVSQLAAELNLSPSTVRMRLQGAGIWTFPGSRSKQTATEANGGQERIDHLRQKLEDAVKREEEENPRRRGMIVPPVHPSQLLKTVLAYREHQNCLKAAESLGVSMATVCNRISGLGLKLRPRAGNSPLTFEASNPPGAVEAVIARLEAEIAACKEASARALQSSASRASITV